MQQGFAVVLVAGLAVFGLMFIASESKFGSSGAPDQEKMKILERNVGNIGDAKSDIRTVDFRDFTVGEIRGDVQAYNAQNTEISNSLLSADSVHIDYKATQPRDGKISFEVLGRRDKGKIYVEINGKKIFERATVSGATPEIEISSNNLRHGDNSIKIGTTKGGLFSSATYTLEDLEVTINDKKFHDFSDSFELYSHELNYYKSSNLSFRIPSGSSRPESDLEIDVNGKKVFSGTLVRSTQNIEIDKREADLTPGYNTIEFKTEGQARYEIENPEIVMRYIGKTSSETVNLNFEMTEGQLSYVEEKNTVEKISFDYQKQTPSTEELIVNINDNKYTHLPKNGYNEIEISEEDFKDENSLRIRSESSFRMQNLQIQSVKSEK